MLATWLPAPCAFAAAAPAIPAPGSWSLLLTAVAGIAGLAYGRRWAARQSAQNTRGAHDPLTGLPDRQWFYRSLQEAVQGARRRRQSLAVLVLDLDQFSAINRAFGHGSADAVLQETARRLRALVRHSDAVARLDGDEFALLLPTAGEPQALAVTRKILRAMAVPHTVSGKTCYLTASIGISVYPDQGGAAESMLQRADLAMQQAKRTGTQYQVYSPSVPPAQTGNPLTAGELRRALERDELELVYQPKLSFGSGHVDSVEALLRWNHPARGQILPGDFIPLAEQTGLIQPLSSWVIRTAVDQCARWRRQGYTITMAINLSAHNLQEPGVIDELRRCLERSRMAAASIVLEITESAMMMQSEPARRTLRQLSAMGVRIAIDDFGTGYSSLSYLQTLPVNQIKIDKSFIINMVRNDNDAIIVRATIDLAHNLGLQVVAEGVESGDALELLEILGCDTAQGFHISKPLQAPALTQWLGSEAGSGAARPH